MEMVELKCPNCGKKFKIPTNELNKKYKNGYVPIFCNFKCELRFTDRHR